MSERAQARQVLEDRWTTQPAVYNGEGGSTYTDRAVGSATVNVQYTGGQTIATTYTAGRTWVIGEGGTPDHWALVLNRYDYATGALLSITGHTTATTVYPGPNASKNYFVPVAMKVIQLVGQSGQDYSPQDTKIIVAGYCRSTSSMGNTDFRTLWFDGDLGDPERVVGFSVPAPSGGTHPPAVDEYPVAMDVQVGDTNAVIAITGNAWNGIDWDISTVFYDVVGGLRHSSMQGTTGADDMAAAISLGGSVNNAFLVGNLGAGSLGGTMAVYNYPIPSPGGVWNAPLVGNLTFPGATLTARALTARANILSQFGVVAGQRTGIDSSHMIMARFNFLNPPPGQSCTVDYVTFAPPAPDPSLPIFQASASAVAYASGTANNGTVFELYAIAGYGWRGAAYGLDPLVCLYDASTSPPRLRWSSWLNQTDPAFAMNDTCTGVVIDSVLSTHEIDKFYVYATGQVSNGADLDWRMGVYSSTDAIDTPTNPLNKTPMGNTLQFSGTGSTPIPFAPELTDIPLSIEPSFNFESDTRYHNFVIMGNIYNGVTPGADLLTRRVRFFAPE